MEIFQKAASSRCVLPLNSKIYLFLSLRVEFVLFHSKLRDVFDKDVLCLGNNISQNNQISDIIFEDTEIKKNHSLLKLILVFCKDLFSSQFYLIP